MEIACVVFLPGLKPNCVFRIRVSAPPSSTMSSSDKREAYQNILGDMQSQFTSQNVPKPFNPSGAVPGGDLPPGEVDMSQIMGLMKK